VGNDNLKPIRKRDMPMAIARKNALIQTLGERFARQMNLHAGIAWNLVQEKLLSLPAKLLALHEMESTGGEPDVVGYDETTEQYIYCDCSAESPIGRRSLCFDRAALDARKANKPAGNAMEMATAMGVEILTEQQYRELQLLSEFDLKTSSWVATPEKIRKRGGALFCDRRFDQVFVYHNGAESYYAARGFRARILL
jgi:Protein of unknown function (DUF4256)